MSQLNNLLIQQIPSYMHQVKTEMFPYVFCVLIYLICLYKYTENVIKFIFQESALQPLDLPLISTTETLENDDIFLSCTADVGKSPGYVKWWRFRPDKSIYLISQSETLSDEAGTCIFVTSSNTTYQVTREDIGAFFRCTSHSNITRDQGPEENSHYRDTEKINVLCEYYLFVGPEMM